MTNFLPFRETGSSAQLCDNGDSVLSISLTDGGGTAIYVQSFGTDPRGDTATGLYAESDQVAVEAQGKNGGTAVSATSDSGTGVSSVTSGNAGEFTTNGAATAVLATAGPNGNATAVHGINTGAGTGIYGESVSGNAVAGHSQTGNAGVFTGPVQVNGTLTVSADIVLSGADCAEEFEVTDNPEIEPGTVMVLDQHGALRSSQHAYDKRVAGVISGAGAYRPGLILDRQKSSEGRVPVALVGKVYCKVDAQDVAIEVGDLLTTSPTPGHAMKAADPFKAFGTVIGKALRPLEAGQGLIPILVALQ
jgi:hypothetical protein